MSWLKVHLKNKYLVLLLFSLLVAVFSFPEMGMEYGTSVDQSLKWLFNHLFTEGFPQGSNLIFPHGPLAFFMYPLAENFLLAVSVTIILQVAFVLQFYAISGKDRWINVLIVLVLSWFIFSISNFNQLVLSNISVGYLNYLKNDKPIHKYWAFLLAAFAFYVRAYVAILAGALTVSFLVIYFFRNRNIRQTVTDAAILLGMMLLFWLLMFHQFSGFVNYCIGMVHLAGDNSAGAALHPKNNWLLLIPFLIIILTIPFVQKTKEAYMFGFLFLFSFFAAWKYGMARQDFHHMRIYLYFTVISMLFFLLYNPKRLLFNIPVIAVALILFALNINNLDAPQPLTINYSGIVNFKDFLTSFSEVKKERQKQNLEKIAINKLPQEIRDKIGDATVDIYPYDYTILAENHLNWKPRPVIQSYVTYTSWLDQKNADHFRKGEGAQYFIFRLNPTAPDINGGKMQSIDGRYLLNDEPRTLIELMTNYQLVFKNENFLVYSKRPQRIEIGSTLTKPSNIHWDSWITVPDSAVYFTRIKLHFDRSVTGVIKSFLYKDENYHMELKTKDGATFRYRIVPQNAEDGLWISPFLTSAGDTVPPQTVTQVMFNCSDIRMVQNNLSYEWEYFDTDKSMVDNFFGKESSLQDKIYAGENPDDELKKRP